MERRSTTAQVDPAISMHKHTASSGSDGARLRLASFTEDEPMSEELSEDGYRTGPDAVFEGPAAWADVDQEEVGQLQRSLMRAVARLMQAHLEMNGSRCVRCASPPAVKSAPASALCVLPAVPTKCRC